MRFQKLEQKTKINPPEMMERVVDQLKRENKTIVTINGSFDLLHAGHLYILQEAARCGDILIVALNTDESIKRYKSPKRPIVSLTHRLEMIAAIGYVDFVTWFNEEDPRELLKILRPDVHVNGSEYGPECIEAEVVKKGGGALHLVDKIGGLSTSQIIEKIKCDC